MKYVVLSLCVLAMLLAAEAQAAPVEYVRVCSVYGAGFFYVPGTDICLNPANGDARVMTEGGTWRTRWPYPDGEWLTRIRGECRFGRLVNLGTFDSSDFELNDYGRVQTDPIALPVTSNQFITKVYMRGGFYDPRIPSRSGTNGSQGLCLRSVDPAEMEPGPEGPFNPPFGNGGLPIACVANSRIVNMPAWYVVTAGAAYPSIDNFFTDAEQTASGPHLYGTHLVVTTDMSPGPLTYWDATDESNKPLAGSVSVSVCVRDGGL